MLTVVVQAGGQSSRMGQDKGLIPFLGKPLIERVVQRVKPIADEMIITTNKPQEYAFLNLPLYPDLIPGRGALGGLYTALSAANNPLVAVIACDMPFINPSLLKAQLDLLIRTQADVVIPHTSEGMEPFHAIYSRAACLPFIKNAVESGKWRADAWFSQVEVTLMHKEQIIEYDPQFLSFSNVNTLEELKAAEILAINL